MVPGKFLSLVDMPKTHVFGIHESTEIVVIGKLEKLISGDFQIVAPSLKAFNYGQQFLIVRFVPNLFWNHFSLEKDYGIL